MHVTKLAPGSVQIMCNGRVQVADLTSSLEKERGYLEQTKVKVQSVEMQRDSASQRETQIRSDLTAARLKLEAAEAEAQALKGQVTTPSS